MIAMSIGKSGRIVVDMEPSLKRELHLVLRSEGTNLKSWFLEKVDEFLAEKSQKSLPFDNNDSREAKG